ncbi:MAG: hypothetical protein LUE08_04100 [Akkermansiaceae bacterium]|nr:hypothetical protein [Akkermansiaceae bacterium]
MEQGEVFELALQTLGNIEFREESPTPDACIRWWPHVLRLAGSRYNWSFASRRAVLEHPKPYPGDRWLYRLPSGLIALTRIMTKDGRRRIACPELVHGGLTVGEDGSHGIMIDYQGDIVSASGELPDSNPMFCDAVVHLLAARIAANLTGSAQLRQSLEQQADNLFIGAISHDKAQDWGNARSPLYMLSQDHLWN